MAGARGGFRRPVSTTCGGIAMMQLKGRNRRFNRIKPFQSNLNLETLEDRLVPAGPSGVVKAMLDMNGVLTVQAADIGNHTIRIAPSPAGGGLIRVSGQAFTSVNSVTFAEFPLSAIASITVNLLTGRENVTV